MTCVQNNLDLTYKKVELEFALTSRKGKTKPMVKLDNQLRQPATV